MTPPTDTQSLYRSGTGATHIETLRGILPYLWPADRPDLRLRVGLAMVALIASKVVTVAVPFAYKNAVDALTVPADHRASQWRRSRCRSSWCSPTASAGS